MVGKYCCELDIHGHKVFDPTFSTLPTLSGRCPGVNFREMVLRLPSHQKKRIGENVSLFTFVFSSLSGWKIVYTSLECSNLLEVCLVESREPQQHIFGVFMLFTNIRISPRDSMTPGLRFRRYNHDNNKIMGIKFF